MSIALVQHKLGADVGNVGASSVSITLTSAVASGDAVTGGLTYSNAGGDKLTSITDDKGNTYNLRSKFEDLTNTQWNVLYDLENITNAPQTITANFSSAAVAFRRMTAAEWSGVATVSAFDGSAGQATTGNTGTDAQSSGNITTTANGDLIYSTFTDDTGTGGSWTQGTGFTSLDIAAGTDNIPMGHEFLIQSSAASVAGTWTQSVSGIAAVMVLALKPAAGAATPAWDFDSNSAQRTFARPRQKLSPSAPDATPTKAFPWLNIGWEVQPPPPPHPRPERFGSIVPHEDGVQAPFARWFNAGWEVQPPQPPRRFWEKAAAVMPKHDGIEATFARFFQFGFENQPAQPPHPRPERSGAQTWGDAGTEAVLVPTVQTVNYVETMDDFVRSPQRRRTGIEGSSEFAAFNLFQFAFDVQAVQPPHPRPERAAALMPLVNIDAAFIPPPFAPIDWVQSPQPRISINLRGAGIAPFPFVDPKFVVWLNAGWEVASPQPPRPRVQPASTPHESLKPFVRFADLDLPSPYQPPHPRPEKDGAIMLGEPGTEAVFVGVTPTPWGYEQPMLHPRIRVERSGTIARGEDGTEGQFSLWRNFGWEVQPPQPPHLRSERFGSIVPRDDGITLPLIRFFQLGFENQPPQPPHPRPERAGAFLRGDDGNEAKFIFVPPSLTPWAYEAPPVISRIRVERTAAVQPWSNIDVTFSQFIPMGWEIAPHQPRILFNRRGSAFAPISTIEAVLRSWFNAGWEVAPVQPPHPRPERSGSLMSGHPEIEQRLIIVPPAWGYQENYLVYPHRGMERVGATMRGDDGTYDPLRRFLATGWEPGLPIVPGRPRVGGAFAVDKDIDRFFPFVTSIVSWGFTQPELAYRRGNAGAILSWEGSWMIPRFVPVFYALTSISQGTAVTNVTAAGSRTVVKGERQGQ